MIKLFISDTTCEFSLTRPGLNLKSVNSETPQFDTFKQR